MVSCIAYPFSEMALSSIKILKERSIYKDIKLVVPKGWFLVEQDKLVDAGRITWGEEIGYVMTNDFEEALEDGDTVIFLDSPNASVIKNDCYEKMIMSAKLGKNIICCMNVEKEFAEEVSNICKSNNKIYEDYSDKIISEYDINDKLYNIETPIVCIGCLFPNIGYQCDALFLAEILSKQGYKVSVVSKNGNIKLAGGFVIPDAEEGMLDSSYIVQINHFVKMIEKRTYPDIILIDIPGAMMKYTNEIHNDFAIEAFCFSQALDSDYFILKSLIGEYPEEFYCRLSECFEHKYGFGIDKVCIDNRIIDFSESLEFRQVVYNYVPNEIVNDYIKEVCEGRTSNYLLNAHDQETYLNIASSIVENLSSGENVAV